MMSSADEITREILGNVPGWLVAGFYTAAAAALAAAAAVFARRMRQHRSGRAEDEPRRPVLQRLAAVVRYVTFHEQLLRDPYAGIAHALIFYGFLVLFIGTCLVFLEHQTPLHFFYGRFYLTSSVILDLGGVALVAGLTMFLWRRRGGGPARLLRAPWVSSLSWVLLLIGLTGFLLEGARIAVDMPAFERWSPVGYGIAWFLRSMGLQPSAIRTTHAAMWAAHAVTSVAFFALLPWGLFKHIAYGAMSWAARAGRPPGQMRLPALDGPSPGAVIWRDLARRDLIQADACTTCGRCNEVCPAHAAGKPLRPREVVLGLREAMDANGAGRQSALTAFVPDEAIWSCTTCGACNQACPVGIEVFDKILDLRRGRVERGVVPESARDVFERTAREFNPMNRPQSERMAWAAGLDVPIATPGESIDTLYWVGCAGSFDPDGQAVSRAMVRILNRLGISYRVLGTRERCTGDPARRMGEEGLFQALARENVRRLMEHGVRRLLTHCPHCYNTWKNEYPQFGARIEVEHHSQFLAGLIAQHRLELAGSPGRAVTLHDPCYLGRMNGQTQPPRDVLAGFRSTTIVEMPRHGTNSFCCGAGGGAMWLDWPGRTRVESLRAEEAAATGASTVATACPFCKSMLGAGKQLLGPREAALEVKDLAELIVERW